jgi:hypothetical protein
VLRVTADKDAGTIEIFVEKMRDGRDRFPVYFAIETPLPGKFAGVPVPRKIRAAEYEVRLGRGSKGTEATEKQARYDHSLLMVPLGSREAFKNGTSPRS